MGNSPAKYNKLTPLQRVYGNMWLFQCDCGNIKEIQYHAVRHGRVKSCGCYFVKCCKEGRNRLKHGDARSGQVVRLHNIWRKIIARCTNPKNASYQHYGARGIAVTPEWSDYTCFKEWAISAGYSDELTIERINNNGNYEPDNCRWATRKEQARNRRTSQKVIFKNKLITIAELSEATGIKAATLYYRNNRGYSIEKLTKLQT